MSRIFAILSILNLSPRLICVAFKAASLYLDKRLQLARGVLM